MAASIATLGHHAQERIYKAKLAGHGMRAFFGETFGVLDERSARDRTMVLAQRHTWFPDEALDCLPEEARLDGWQTMRVKFEQVVLAVSQVCEHPWGFFDEPGRSSYKVEDGVWDIEHPVDVRQSL